MKENENLSEDQDDNFELTPDMISILDKRQLEDPKTYLTAEESLKRLSEKLKAMGLQK